MRKLYLLTAIVLLSTVWVVAQTAPSSSSPSQQPSTADQASPSTASPSQSSPSQSTTTTQTTTTETTQTSTAGSSIEGCLAGSAGNFTLADTAGKTWQLAGDTSKLSDHVGHQVRITGSEAGGAAGSASSPSTGAAAGAGASTSGSASSSGAQPTFTVSKVKMISSSCPTPSK
jgi:mannan endo-1,4-beta-mannosidase